MIGVPDYRLFFRGDETEMHRRMVRSGLPFGTSLAAAYLHPRRHRRVQADARRAAVTPSTPTTRSKRYYTYRNRGYLMARRACAGCRPLECPRFGWYFLVTRRDPQGFAEWVRLLRQGRAERFDRL